MINKIRIVNFKCHKDTSLEFGNLTVLSGQNGVGKSSVIQSLLLLRQTFQKNRLDKVLELNDPLCFIGKSEDALYRFPNEELGEELSIVLSDNVNEYSWIFEEVTGKRYLNRINELDDSSGFDDLSLFKENFQYISASRGYDYETDDYAVEVQKQISFKEGKGELIAQFLNEYGKKVKVIESLKHESEEDDFLLSQVTAWEREISLNVNVEPVQLGDGYDIKYSFDTTNELGPVGDLSKRNVGFGLSYALPLITAILSSKKDSIILIENPEAHIHPYGIAKLTELICLASQAGIQIIVETHSDHIINGILVQCKKSESSSSLNGIERENVKIYFFNRNDKEHATETTLLPIIEGGKIQSPPEGFFDQLDIDMDELLGI